ncbi:SDR family oxidoreductase [Humibacter soli]
MTGRRLLFLGGTGTVSASCVRQAVRDGHDVTVVNRGTGRRPLPEGVRRVVADIRDKESIVRSLRRCHFDAVADFLSFTPDDVRSTLDCVEGMLDQYVFVSSASAYEKPPKRLPITESTPLRNPYSPYAQNKIACEDHVMGALRDRGLPATIVRPSHTYDEQLPPTIGRWTDIARMRMGLPIVVPGDGTTLWTITHADDFAVGFVALLGNPAAVGEVYQITGDHAPTWNRIYRWLAEAAGVTEPVVVHVASETLIAFQPELEAKLLGDKAHSMVFDNTKIRSVAPQFRPSVTFDVGARQIVEYFDTLPESDRIDQALDALFDAVIEHVRQR